MLDRELFVERIRALYEKQDLIPEDLETFAAKNSSVSYKELRQCLNDEYKILSADLVLAFAALYGCSTDYLLGVSKEDLCEKIPEQLVEVSDPLSEQEQALLDSVRSVGEKPGLLPALTKLIDQFHTN